MEILIIEDDSRVAELIHTKSGMGFILKETKG